MAHLVVDSELLGSRVCAVPATDGFISGAEDRARPRRTLSHCSGRRGACEAVLVSLRIPMKFPSVPAPPFRHLLRLTYSVGVIERADGIMPRYEHGYPCR